MRTDPPEEMITITTVGNDQWLGYAELMLWVHETLKGTDVSNLRAVEVGAYMGESTSMLASSGLFRGGITVVDTWGIGIADGNLPDVLPVPSGTTRDQYDWDWVQKEFETNIRPFTNPKSLCKVSIIRGESHRVLDEFDDGSLDFIYIDADHRYMPVVRDIELYLPKLKKGGIIAGHDYCDYWQSVVDAVHDTVGKPDKVCLDGSWAKVVNGEKA